MYEKSVTTVVNILINIMVRQCCYRIKSVGDTFGAGY